MKKILITIPAYNEEHNIGKVIGEIKKEKLSLDILVINDGSKDNTSAVAKASGVMVADLPINLGIGGARQTGLIYALKNNYDFLIQMDADGQHATENINHLLQSSRRREVIIGSRFIKKKYKGALSRRIGIIILSLFLKVITGERITDPTSGLRIFNRRAIKFLAKNYPVDYPEVEPLVFLHWAGFKIHEIEAVMNPRMSGRSSIAPVYYMVKVILAVSIDLFRQKPMPEE